MNSSLASPQLKRNNKNFLKENKSISKSPQRENHTAIQTQVYQIFDPDQKKKEHVLKIMRRPSNNSSQYQSNKLIK